jgi:hypothetical protein
VVLLGKGLSEDLRNYLKYHIDLEIMETDGFNWRFTSLYGEPRKNKRFLTWKLLIFFASLEIFVLVRGRDFSEFFLGTRRWEEEQKNKHT